MANKSKFMMINPAELKGARFQPGTRTAKRALHGLKENIGAHGILSPLVIVKNGIGYYVADGNRRRECAMQLGVTEVPCFVHDSSSEDLPSTWGNANKDMRKVSSYEWMCAWHNAKPRGCMTETLPERVLVHIKACETIFGPTGIEWMVRAGVSPAICVLIFQTRSMLTNERDRLRANNPKAVRNIPPADVIGRWLVEHKNQGLIQSLGRTGANARTLSKLLTRILADERFDRGDLVT